MRNWELHVHFKVHGKGRDLFGDGMAIWYVRDRLQLGKYRSTCLLSPLLLSTICYSNKYIQAQESIKQGGTVVGVVAAIARRPLFIGKLYIAGLLLNGFSYKLNPVCMFVFDHVCCFQALSSEVKTTFTV